jgi:hypothetical protein
MTTSSLTQHTLTGTKPTGVSSYFILVPAQDGGICIEREKIHVRIENRGEDYHDANVKTTLDKEAERLRVGLPISVGLKKAQRTITTNSKQNRNRFAPCLGGLVCNYKFVESLNVSCMY